MMTDTIKAARIRESIRKFTENQKGLKARLEAAAKKAA